MSRASRDPGTYPAGVEASLRTRAFAEATRTGVLVELMVYIDLQPGDAFRIVKRRRVDENDVLKSTLDRIVWTDGDVPQKTWTPIAFEIAAQAGSPFALDFQVVSGAGPGSKPGSVSIDDVVLTPTCAPPPDGSDEDDDNDGGST